MINNAVLMGRLTTTPELKTTQNSTPVTTFSLAVERNYAKAGEERQTDFIDIVAWRKTAEFITRYFSKGDMIAVQGEIQTRNYEDKNGNKRKAVEVVAQSVSFCGSKREEPKQTEKRQEPAVEKPTIEQTDFTEFPTNFDDGLPF